MAIVTPVAAPVDAPVAASVAAPAEPPVAVVEGGPLAAASGEGYDWARWNRAVRKWYDTCVREDAQDHDSVEDDEDEDEDYDTDEMDMPEGDAPGLDGAPGGELPGAMAGGGMLEEFLGREACFALKCATDQVSRRKLDFWL